MYNTTVTYVNGIFLICLTFVLVVGTNKHINKTPY